MVAIRMPFGKWKGRLLTAIPYSYLSWLLREATTIDDDLYDAVQAELRRRLVDGDAGDDGGSARGRQGGSAGGGLEARLPDLIQQWYREMALAYHPDRGGSHEAMKAISRAHERLRELVGV
jgi:hypothetical protein